MAGWDGNGVFSRSHDWTDDQANGIKIRADRHDTNDVDFVSGINNCMTKDGQNSATADLDMGGNKLTNGASGTLVGDFTIVSDIQNSVQTYATSTGSANAYVLTLAPAPAAYVAGQSFGFKANFASTGAVTLNVNGLGAKAINRYGLIALLTGEIRVDQIVVVTYDGTQFQATSINDVPVPTASKFGAIVVQNTADDGYELLSGQGTSGQVLVSNGADALPSFQAGAGWATQRNVTISSDVTVEFETGVSGVDFTVFDEYRIVVKNVRPATDDQTILLSMSVDGGTTPLSMEFIVTSWASNSGTFASTQSESATAATIFQGAGTGTGEGVDSVIEFGNLNSALYKNVYGRGVQFNSDANCMQQTFTGTAPSTSIVDSITFSTSSTSIASGNLILQGRNF